MNDSRLRSSSIFPTGSNGHHAVTFPFHDYLIPGIILLVANGLFSFIVLTLLLFRFRASEQFVLIQGVLLTGWIGVQVILIRRFDILQLVFVAIGIGLILLGYNGRRTDRRAAVWFVFISACCSN